MAIKGNSWSSALFLKMLKQEGIETPVSEYRFHPPRRWRFDFCFVKSRLVLEVEGGVWSSGRHTRGSGFVKDIEKYNQAAVDGFYLLRVTPQQMESGEAAFIVKDFFKARNWYCVACGFIANENVTHDETCDICGNNL